MSKRCATGSVSARSRDDSDVQGKGSIPFLVFRCYRQGINESSFYEEERTPAIQPVSNVVK